MPENWIFWLAFVAFVLLMLWLDLIVMGRRKAPLRFAQALLLSGFWVSLAAAFAALLWFFGQQMAGDTLLSNRELTLQFVTGYVVEESLSVDNLFVFLLIFRFFQVPGRYQHRVLALGIIGALAMRGLFIAVGVALIDRFHFVLYLFGVFLVYAGVKLAFGGAKEAVSLENNALVGWLNRHMRLTSTFVGEHFIVRRGAQLFATPLLLTLIVIETTDVIFATDSIPAILAITRDPFIVFTSNVFAVLGLRALYFALAGMMESFHLLHYGLAIILGFIGGKMLVSRWVEVPTVWALGVVLVVLALSVALSRMFPGKAASPSA